MSRRAPAKTPPCATTVRSRLGQVRAAGEDRRRRPGCVERSTGDERPGLEAPERRVHLAEGPPEHLVHRPGHVLDRPARVDDHVVGCPAGDRLGRLLESVETLRQAQQHDAGRAQERGVETRVDHDVVRGGGVREQLEEGPLGRDGVLVGPDGPGCSGRRGLSPGLRSPSPSSPTHDPSPGRLRRTEDEVPSRVVEDDHVPTCPQGRAHGVACLVQQQPPGAVTASTCRHRVAGGWGVLGDHWHPTSVPERSPATRVAPFRHFGSRERPGARRRPETSPISALRGTWSPEMASRGRKIP